LNTLFFLQYAHLSDLIEKALLKQWLVKLSVGQGEYIEKQKKTLQKT